MPRRYYHYSSYYSFNETYQSRYGGPSKTVTHVFKFGVPICDYCKKPGHKYKDCRQRMIDMGIYY